MLSRRTMIALASLIALQMLGALGFVAANVAAQTGEFVVVVIGEKSRDACEVQHRKSDNDQWGQDSREGPPVACEGGIVTAYIVAEEQAPEEEDAARSRARSSGGSSEVRIVQLTGNDANDQAAVKAEIDAIHNLFAPDVQVEEEGDELAFAPDGTLGFIAPGALADDPLRPLAPAAAVLSANCRTGRVGQERRADFRWTQPGIGVRILAYLFYKRISCRQWRITEVQIRQIDDYELSIFLHDLEYTKAWFPGPRVYAKRVSDPFPCTKLREGGWINYRPLWDIQAGGKAEIETVDTHPRSPSPAWFWSCDQGEGTSATSVATRLAGGVS